MYSILFLPVRYLTFRFFLNSLFKTITMCGRCWLVWDQASITRCGLQVHGRKLSLLCRSFHGKWSDELYSFVQPVQTYVYSLDMISHFHNVESPSFPPCGNGVPLRHPHHLSKSASFFSNDTLPRYIDSHNIQS